MNKTPRTAAFKKKIALQALREQNTIEEIAREYGLHRVQVCKWKKKLLDGAESVFETKNKKKINDDEDKIALERKVGQLTIEIDWLKKTREVTVNKLWDCIDATNCDLSVTRQCQLLNLNRSSYYLEPLDETV